MLKVATFNVNSLRMRMDILLGFLHEHKPDIVGLQETKVQDEDFPLEPLVDAGYEVSFHGQKTHYGVATLCKTPFLSVQMGVFEQGDTSRATDTDADDGHHQNNAEHAAQIDAARQQKRLIHTQVALEGGAILHVLNGYFPQGENRKHPVKFPAKLAFYSAFFAKLAQLPPEDFVLVMGDFNIAQEDIDVGIGEVNRKRWLQAGKCSFLPEEREMFASFYQLGFADTYRKHYPTDSERMSWFDYRSKGFEDTPKRGLRIDGIMANAKLYATCSAAGIDYKTRALPRPSDHCPVWSHFDLDLG